MNRLEQLLEELCPEGVDYYELREVFEIKNGYTPSKSEPSFWENGTVPWFRMEDIRENGRILSDSLQHVTLKAVKGGLFPADSIIVATSATIGEHALITVDSLANQRFTYLTRKKEFVDRIEPMFAYYYCFKLDEWCLSNIYISSFASVDMTKFARFKFPVPPLSVQNEIVRILDSFSGCTAQLTANLEKEFKVRKKQFKYYRDKLLTPKNNIPKQHLSECCTTIADGDHQPPPKKEKGIPFITISNITNHNQIDFSKTMFVSPEYYERLAHKRRAQAGDILYTVVGSFGIAVYIETDYKFVFQRHIAILRPDRRTVLPKYLYHAMQATAFYSQADTAAKGAAQRTISLASLNRMEIPVPPLEEQARIVSILDRFDVLCNDLTSGLPAEIEARRRQYEHYRDKLLRFKEIRNAE